MTNHRQRRINKLMPKHPQVDVYLTRADKKQWHRWENQIEKNIRREYLQFPIILDNHAENHHAAIRQQIVDVKLQTGMHHVKHGHKF